MALKNNNPGCDCCDECNNCVGTPPDEFEIVISGVSQDVGDLFCPDLSSTFNGTHTLSLGSPTGVCNWSKNLTWGCANFDTNCFGGAFDAPFNGTMTLWLGDEGAVPTGLLGDPAQLSAQGDTEIRLVLGWAASRTVQAQTCGYGWIGTRMVIYTASPLIVTPARLRLRPRHA